VSVLRFALLAAGRIRSLVWKPAAPRPANDEPAAPPLHHTTQRRIPLYRVALSAALLITACAYLQTTFFEFAYDDLPQIVYNPRIKSWDLALGYFTSDVWAQVGGLPVYYRPVFMLWLRANHALFGLNPVYWHLATLALHLLCCLLLYFFVCRLTEDRWIAVVTVLLFGLHPAHVEGVAWISGATEPLLASLLLGCLLCYLKHRDFGDTKMDSWQAASLLLAFLAILAKETALVIPFLIFSYEWIFGKRETSQGARLLLAVRTATPYALILVVYLILRTFSLKRLSPPHTTSLGSVLLAWPKVILFYAGHTLFPFRLSVFYKLMTVTHPGMQNVVLPLILMCAGAAVLWYGSRHSRVFAFLAAWGVVMLIPILNVTLLYNVENVHDRYLYLPSAAFCILLASLLARLKEINATKTATGALVVIAVGYALVTMRESHYWRNDVILAQHGIAVSPDHPVALQVLGNAYIREERIAEAIPYLWDSLKVLPYNVNALCSLAECYTDMNALPLAEECLTKAMALNGSLPLSHLLLGIVRFKQNRLDEAEVQIRRGIELQRTPRSIMLFHYHLAEVLYARGDMQGAMSEYLLELRNDPAIDPAVTAARAQIHQIEKQFQLRMQR
jgi:hypothetical protein